MQRFKNILLVTDEKGAKSTTFLRAVDLAKRNAARLTLVAVVDDDLKAKLPVYGASAELQEKLLAQHDAQLKRLAAQATKRRVQARTKLLTGISFIEIIREVLRGRHDLLIKTVGGKGMLGSFFGSLDMHLMRKCPCPVWIVKPMRRHRYMRILAAVDPFAADDTTAGLNTLVMDLATSLARAEKGELHVAHAWHLFAERKLRSGGRPGLTSAKVEELVRDVRRAHRSDLNALLSAYDLEDLAVRTHLLKGKPADVIPALAKKQRVDLIVMGTVARTGIPGFFIGNTAESILSRVDCSVLTLKPKGFRSPVTPGK